MRCFVSMPCRWRHQPSLSVLSECGCQWQGEKKRVQPPPTQRCCPLLLRRVTVGVPGEYRAAPSAAVAAAGCWCCWGRDCGLLPPTRTSHHPRLRSLRCGSYEWRTRTTWWTVRRAAAAVSAALLRGESQRTPARPVTPPSSSSHQEEEGGADVPATPLPDPGRQAVRVGGGAGEVDDSQSVVPPPPRECDEAPVE